MLMRRVVIKERRAGCVNEACSDKGVERRAGCVNEACSDKGEESWMC